MAAHSATSAIAQVGAGSHSSPVTSQNATSANVTPASTGIIHPMLTVRPGASSTDRFWEMIVVDLQFDGQDPTVQFRAGRNEVASALNTLAPIEPRTARIYEINGPEKPPQDLYQHLESLTASKNLKNDVDYRLERPYNLRAIFSQWTSILPPWLLLEVCQWDLDYRDSTTKFGRSTIRCFPLDQERLAVYCEKINSLKKINSLDVYGYLLSPSLSSNNALTRFSKGSRSAFIKLILLERLRRELERATDYLHRAMSNRSCGRPVSEIELIVKFGSQLSTYENILEWTKDLTNAVEFLVSTALPENTSSPNISEPLVLLDTKAYLLSSCAHANDIANRIFEREQQRRAAYLAVLGMEDSQSFKRLTILAAIFLPLALASSILSMQTRFVNLKLLLYDFIGVFLIIGSIAILGYVILKGLVSLTPETEFRTKYAPWKVHWWSYKGIDPDVADYSMILFFKYFLLSIIWLIFLSSFLVGMLKDVILGVKILGYGLAALFGTLLILFMLILCQGVFCSGPF